MSAPHPRDERRGALLGHLVFAAGDSEGGKFGEHGSHNLKASSGCDCLPLKQGCPKLFQWGPVYLIKTRGQQQDGKGGNGGWWRGQIGAAMLKNKG